MARPTKKFVVFNGSDEIYVAEEHDESLQKLGELRIFDSLADAKEAAKQNLKEEYEIRLDRINNKKYRDF